MLTHCETGLWSSLSCTDSISVLSISQSFMIIKYVQMCSDSLNSINSWDQAVAGEGEKGPESLFLLGKRGRLT